VDEPPSRFRGTARRVIPASRWFSRILVFVILVMFLCLIGMIVMAIMIPNATASQAAVEDKLSTGFFTGLSALIGFIGGKLTP